MKMYSLKWIYAALLTLHCLLVRVSVSTALKCSSDSYCTEKLREGSSCDNGVCTNPFAKGCLQAILNSRGSSTEDLKILKTRICNSDDDDSTETEGVCTTQNRLLKYKETRISPNNWESSIFFGWIAQILLSEVLGVPASIETGNGNNTLNFYDRHNSFSYPEGANNFKYLVKSNELDAKNKDCSETTEPCAHFMPEVWVRPKGADQRKAVDRDSNGIISGTGWYIPNYTLEKYPFLASYVGLQDKKNSTVIREKLASIFKRPMTWKEYCASISESKCITKDEIADRLPQDDESDRFFHEEYKGYFHPTDKNDCTAGSCSGHMIDYPCDWFSYTDMQIHWNNIGLETDIEYTSSRINEVLNAAKASQADVIITWWYPTPDIKNYFRIALPKVTNECLNQRELHKSERCDETETERKGNKGSGCDYLLDMTDKYYATSFLNSADNTPHAKRNPSSQFLKKLQISDIDIDDILGAWNDRGIDRHGFDGREAVCLWVADNLEDGSNLMQYIPRGFPRKVPEDSVKMSLSIGTIVFGAIVSVFVLATQYATYRFRKVKVIVYSQPHFLYLFCAGYFLISISAIFYGIQPSNGICIVREWFVLVGYTMGNVPLLVKTAAINTLMQHAKKMKRVQISQKKLFGIVSGVLFISIVYLICWTAIDPSQKDEELILVSETSGEVELQVSCKSRSKAWTIVAHVMETFYILCSSVLAVQSRKVIQKFNESKDVGNMAYVSFLFLVFRLLVYYIPSNVLDPSISDGITSIILSLDAVANIMVYFAPKFFKIYKNDAEAVGKTRTRHISGLNSNSTSTGKNSFICVECKQQKHISRASSMDPSQVSRLSSCVGPQSQVESTADIEKGNDTATLKSEADRRISFHTDAVANSMNKRFESSSPSKPSKVDIEVKATNGEAIGRSDKQNGAATSKHQYDDASLEENSKSVADEKNGESLPDSVEMMDEVDGEKSPLVVTGSTESPHNTTESTINDGN